MATNTGNGYRKGSVRDRTQTQNPKTGLWTKRDTETGRFMDVKQDGEPSRELLRSRTADAAAESSEKQSFGRGRAAWFAVAAFLLNGFRAVYPQGHACIDESSRVNRS